VADTRELILSRLVTVCAGVTGIVSAIRDQSDVPLTSRPGIIVHGGAEAYLDSPPNVRFAQVQRMQLSPVVELRLRADTGAEAGALISLYRGRILNAVAGDATLQGYVGRAGDIRLESFSQLEPLPESKEPRANWEFIFTYTLKRADLTA